MMTIFRVKLRPPSGVTANGDEEPLRAEVHRTTPAIHLPDVGERFAFVDDCGHHQAGTIVERRDVGFTDQSGRLVCEALNYGTPYAAIVDLVVEGS